MIDETELSRRAEKMLDKQHVSILRHKADHFDAETIEALRHQYDGMCTMLTALGAETKRNADGTHTIFFSQLQQALWIEKNYKKPRYIAAFDETFIPVGFAGTDIVFMRGDQVYRVATKGQSEQAQWSMLLLLRAYAESRAMEMETSFIKHTTGRENPMTWTFRPGWKKRRKNEYQRELRSLSKCFHRVL